MLKDVPSTKLPSVVQATLFGADPFGYLRKQYEKYGDYYILKLPGDPPRVVVSDPDAVQQIFALGKDDLDSPRGNTMHINIGEQSLIFLDGDHHAQQRKIVTPPFNGKGMLACGDYIAKRADLLITELPVGKTEALLPYFHQFTLDVIFYFIFGSQQTERHERLRWLISEWASDGLAMPMFLGAMIVNGNRVRRYLNKKTEESFNRHAKDNGWQKAKPSRILPIRVAEYKAEIIKLLMDDIIECREAQDDSRTDALAMFSRTTYEDGSLLELSILVDHLVTLILAGNHTSSTTIAWAIYDVIGRPEILAEINAERERVFGDGPIDASRINELDYLEGALNESMRLKPISPVVPRCINKPMKIGPYLFEEGTLLWPCGYNTQMNPTLWPEPEKFIPERFMGVKTAQSAFFPFGGGRKRCLGSGLAYYEMKIALSELFYRTEMHLPADSKTQAIFKGINITPSDELRMTVTNIKSQKTFHEISEEVSADA